MPDLFYGKLYDLAQDIIDPILQNKDIIQKQQNIVCFYVLQAWL